MSTKGRPRSTITHLELAGLDNHGDHKNYNKEAPNLITTDTELKCPKKYSKETKKVWNAIVPSLVLQGVLTEKDLPSLSLLFEHYQNYIDARKLYDSYEIDLSLSPKELQTQTYNKRQFYAIMSDAMKEFNKLCAEFGLTPTTRSKLPIVEKSKPEDPLEVVISG